MPGLYYVMDGSASGDHYTGLLAILAGLVLILSAPVTLWKARRTGGSRRRRYLRRSLSTGIAVVTGVAAIVFLVFPVGFTYGYTHIGRTSPAAPLGLAHENVKITTSDGIELTGSVRPLAQPSGNGRVPGRLGRQGGADARAQRLRRAAARPAADRAEARATSFAGPATAT